MSDVFAFGFSISTVTFLSVSNTIPADLGSVERVISYLGLLAMGWFFWKRETNRTDKSIEDLKAENAMLKRDNMELQKDIRALLENRSSSSGVRRPPTSTDEHDQI